jgi:hypothetical protein
MKRATVFIDWSYGEYNASPIYFEYKDSIEVDTKNHNIIVDGVKVNIEEPITDFKLIV